MSAEQTIISNNEFPAEQEQTLVPENEIPVEQPVVPEQTIRPLNDVVSEPTERRSIVINLNRCEWRYPREFILKYNKNEKEKGRTFFIPYEFANWQKPKSYLF